ncbi:MAG: type II toxin-antitoxin system RelE/ParE family toxin [Azoarcus sp.]|jgi:plasmid stabilization system protein ParE|nr:type II toxin-antitoxin system RelE/ParE family toxin [Azoarcus sp.]
MFGIVPLCLNIHFGKYGYVARYRLDEDIDEIVVLAIRHGKEAGFGE